VAGWPSIERAEDAWLAESLGSDRAAPARLYDLYAARLFDYCHVLLRDERAAAEALLDALLTVRESGGDPGSFRGRLYAVTREVCVRRRPVAPAERRRAAEAASDATDETTRRLVHAALLVLSGRQREVLDLSLRHGLRTDDLAQVLRTSPDDAASIVVRARRGLDDAFVAVLLAATGRDCPGVASLAGPQGRQLDGRTCEILARHVAACPVCARRGDLEISTARLLDAMPVAAVPEGLRERYLAADDPSIADAPSPLTVAARPTAAGSTAAGSTAAGSTAAGRRAGRAAARRASHERSRTGPRLWPVAAGVAFATAMAGGTFYALSGTGSQNTGNDQAMPSSPGDSLSDVPTASESSLPLSGRGSAAPSPTPSDSSDTPTPTPGHSTPETTPDPIASTSHTQAPPPPAAGTLVVSGCSMGHHHSCTITVTASGGPVSWSVTGTSGGVRAAGGGFLNPGESASVTATRDGSWCYGHHSGSVVFSSGAAAPVDWYC
jgi:DNA-directed RNA polymerase specialized sigma24 family protein